MKNCHSMTLALIILFTILSGTKTEIILRRRNPLPSKTNSIVQSTKDLVSDHVPSRFLKSKKMRRKKKHNHLSTHNAKRKLFSKYFSSIKLFAHKLHNFKFFYFFRKEIFSICRNKIMICNLLIVLIKLIL